MIPPSVSAIIPAYQSEAFLAEAIQSVLDQTVAPDEIIVVDDGSTDRSARVAASFGRQVRLIIQENQGVSAARNRALSVARGSLIAFLDADDYWAPTKVEKQSAAFAGDPALDVSFTHMIEFDTRSESPVYRPPEPGCLPSTLMARRSVFDRIGSFAPGFVLAEAVDWCLRARDAGLRDLMLPEALTYRRIHGGNFSLQQKVHQINLVRSIKASLDRRRSGQPPDSKS